jgi:riboflavin transport system permease protein
MRVSWARRLGGRALPRIVALGAALLFALLYALLASSNPREALSAFFLGPFSSRYSFNFLLESTAPLLACALGACIAFRAGAFNLGGEGQASVGTLAAALAAGALGGIPQLPSALGIAAAMLAAALAGSCLALLSAIAERRAGAQVMLTSFLFAQAAIIAVDWAIGGPLRDQGSNLLAMPAVGLGLRLPLLSPPSPLSAAFPLAVLLAVCTIFFTKGTRTGSEIRLLGKNPVFARAVGLSPRLGAWAMVLSGALAGIAGSFLVLGQAGRALKGMTGGVGWNGLAVALIAGSDGLGALPSALFFSWLDAGSRQASILSDLSPDASSVLTAVALFLITSRLVGPESGLLPKFGNSRARPKSARSKSEKARAEVKG